MKLFMIITSILLVLQFSPATAQEKHACSAHDKTCLFAMLEKATAEIDAQDRKDKTYRELAKLLAKEKDTAKAITLIQKIEKPDTKAMTIRGIGMAAAENALTKEEYDALFSQLAAEAEKITHPPSHAIALTYIAMAQAFAGDNDGAMKTAGRMENDALRHKAFGETAEIQAEHGDLNAARISLAAISNLAFRNKAHRIVSKIFADRAFYDEALKIAEPIENPYHKVQAILYILFKQIEPEEVSVE